MYPRAKADHTSRSHPSISPSPPRSNPHRPLQISHCRVLPILPCADITSPGTRQNPSPLCAPRGSVPRAQRVASGIPNPWRSRTVPIRFPSHAPSSPPPFPSRSREVPELPRRLLRYCMEQALPPCMHACVSLRGAPKRSAQRGRQGLEELQSFL